MWCKYWVTAASSLHLFFRWSRLVCETWTREGRQLVRMAAGSEDDDIIVHLQAWATKEMCFLPQGALQGASMPQPADPRRYIARQVEKKMILMICLQWNSLLSSWRDGWYFVKSFLHFIINSLLKGIPEGDNFLSLAFVFQLYTRTIAIAANPSIFPGMFLIKTWVDFQFPLLFSAFWRIDSPKQKQKQKSQKGKVAYSPILNSSFPN